MQVMQHDNIATQARIWVGVPYLHQGRARTGIDCLGLLIKVAEALALRGRDGQLLTLADRLDYSIWPDVKAFQSALEQTLEPVTTLKSGLVALFSLCGRAQHVGLLADYPQGGISLIHAYAPLRCVVEHRLDNAWKRRLCGLYQIPDQP